MAENLRNIDLNLLTALNALLDDQHVSHAADKLNLSQSAMSRTLSRLRLTFSDPLLVRGREGMILTERAEQLRLPLKEVLGQIKGLLHQDVFDAGTTIRHFHVKGTSYVSQVYLPAALNRFYREAPHASLSIHNLDMNDMTGNGATSIDLVLCGDGMGIPDSFKRLHLGYDRMVVVMSAGHPLAAKELTIDDYVKYPHSLIMLGGGSDGGTMEPVLSKLGYRRNIQLRNSHYIAGLEMVGRSHLLLTVTSNVVKRFKDQFNLIMKPLPFAFDPIEYYFAWHPVHDCDPGQVWLRNLFYQEIQKVFGKPITQ